MAAGGRRIVGFDAVVLLIASVLALALMSDVARLPRAGAETTAPDDRAVFSASATGDGTRLAASNESLPVERRPVDAGAPTVAVALDSIGTSTGIAAQPSPGDVVVAAPGLVASQGGPQLPPYPFLASSNFPTTPHQRVTYPGYVLDARSDDHSSTAEAIAGPLPTEDANAAFTRTHARAQFDRSAGVLTADSESIVRGLRLGKDVEVGWLRSRAVATAGPGASRTLRAELEIGALVVGGQSVTATDEGISLVSGSGDVLRDAEQRLNGLLQPHGAAISLLAGSVDEARGTVTSPAMVLSTASRLPAVEGTAVEYVLGRSSATAMLTVEPAPVVSDAPAVVAGGPLPPSSLGTPGGSPPVGPAAAGAPTVTAPLPRAVTVSNERSGMAPFSIAGLYFGTALIVVLVVALGQFFRLRGVRVPWTL